VPPPISAVSDADVRTDAEAGVAADGDSPGEGDGGAEDPAAGVAGDADGDGAAREADGDAEGDADGEAEADGDAEGCEDPVAADADPTTRWPAGICAEPVVTSARDPTGGGASAGTGAACPLIPPGAAVARVAEAGT
jgi:hypothetical protein